MKDTFERFLCSLKWGVGGAFLAFLAFFSLVGVASAIMSLVLLVKILMGMPCEWYLIASPVVICVLYGIYEAWSAW